jgi:hypothetical protein
MSTPSIDTTVADHESTPRCAAHRLEGQQRQTLALQGLASTQPISTLSAHHGVSRKFVYQQMHKAAEALEHAFDAQVPEEAVLFYLPVTKAWLRQAVMGLVLLCHSSYRGVMQFLRDLLDTPISLGTVHNIVQATVTRAQQINAAQDLSRARASTHDELFQAGLPVLAGLDLDSLYCYLLAVERHRDAETWAIHLLDLKAQGLHPDYTLADGARGLRAGQALAWPDVPCEADVFHALRDFAKVANQLEKRAYACIAKRTAIESEMQKATERKQGQRLSTPLAQARAQESSAIRLADDVQTLLEWFHHDVLAPNGLDTDSRTELYPFVTDALARLESVNGHRIRPLRRRLERERGPLLGFATRLDQGLKTIAVEHHIPLASVRELFALQHLSPTTQAYWAQATRLHRQLRGQLYAAQTAVRALDAHLHRASSLVENFNGRLRSYFFLRRQLGSRYLDLLRFFFNHHPFQRSQRPKRVGKTPAELLTGQSHPHWLELLGFTRFTRASEAT